MPRIKTKVFTLIEAYVNYDYQPYQRAILDTQEEQDAQINILSIEDMEGKRVAISDMEEDRLCTEILEGMEL